MAEKKCLDAVFRSYGARLRAEKEKIEANCFTGEKEKFYNCFEHKILARVGQEDRSLNDERFIELIRNEKPDAIVVMGTCLVSRRIIESASCVINMHTGLSPYYRGGQTNFWPYLFGDMDCFGVTIHKMSTGIDSGDIIHSAQIKAEPGDTYASINCKAIVKGTDLMVGALKLCKEGALHSLPQWEKGKIFNSRDYNHFHAFRYYRLIGNSMPLKAGAQKRVKIVVNGEMHHA